MSDILLFTYGFMMLPIFLMIIHYRRKNIDITYGDFFIAFILAIIPIVNLLAVGIGSGFFNKVALKKK